MTGDKIRKQAAEAKAKTQAKKGKVPVTQSSGQPKDRDLKEKHANSAAGQLAAAAKVGVYPVSLYPKRHIGTPWWLIEISPGVGVLPPPTSPASLIVWWGLRKGRRAISGWPGGRRPIAL